jgi:hypothetical protein
LRTQTGYCTYLNADYSGILLIYGSISRHDFMVEESRKSGTLSHRIHHKLT